MKLSKTNMAITAGAVLATVGLLSLTHASAVQRHSQGEAELSQMTGTTVHSDASASASSFIKFGGAPDNPCDWDGNPDNPTDDPNPDYNGSIGRVKVSSNPIPEGYPTPLTTGLCSAGIEVSSLTSTQGRTIKTDGAVIDGEDIDGTLKIQANNVTVKRSRITSGGGYALDFDSGYKNLLVEDVRIRSVGGERASSAVYTKGPATLRRVHVSGAPDNLKSNSGNLTVVDSYFAGLYLKPGSHNDTVQVRAGSNYTFRHNSMIGNCRHPSFYSRPNPEPAGDPYQISR